MRLERTQWRVRCATDGDLFVSLVTGAPAPTQCPNDATHAVVSVTRDRYLRTEYDPTTSIAGLSSVHLVVANGDTCTHATPITSPAGWLVNAAGQLLLEG